MARPPPVGFTLSSRVYSWERMKTERGEFNEGSPHKMNLLHVIYKLTPLFSMLRRRWNMFLSGIQDGKPFPCTAQPREKGITEGQEEKRSAWSPFISVRGGSFSKAPRVSELPRSVPFMPLTHILASTSCTLHFLPYSRTPVTPT